MPHLASRPALLAKILNGSEINEEGVYGLVLCKEGRWEGVIVDDYFPCTYERTLAFAHNVSGGSQRCILSASSITWQTEPNKCPSTS